MSPKGTRSPAHRAAIAAALARPECRAKRSERSLQMWERRRSGELPWPTNIGRKKGSTLTPEHRRRIGEGVRRAAARRASNGRP